MFLWISLEWFNWTRDRPERTFHSSEVLGIWEVCVKNNNKKFHYNEAMGLEIRKHGFLAWIYSYQYLSQYYLILNVLSVQALTNIIIQAKISNKL